MGGGTQRLAEKTAGQELELLGPIGNFFELSAERKHPLLIGGGVGLPPILFFARSIRELADPEIQVLLLAGSEVPFPFETRPSKIMVDGCPADSIACVPLLDDWGMASRLASSQDFPGCFHGHVTELAKHFLRHRTPDILRQTEVFACGPEPMLRAAAQVAKEFELPCRLSLEEYMACAVGGCAGCVVPVHKDGDIRMSRVCVDGPVFEAAEIYP